MLDRLSVEVVQFIAQIIIDQRDSKCCLCCCLNTEFPQRSDKCGGIVCAEGKDSNAPCFESVREYFRTDIQGVSKDSNPGLRRIVCVQEHTLSLKQEYAALYIESSNLAFQAAGNAVYRVDPVNEWG
jgi:hypothetical protein